MCEPIFENGKAGYRFTATGTFDRLLTGTRIINSSINYSGGGQANEPSLAPFLSFEFQGVALVA